MGFGSSKSVNLAQQKLNDDLLFACERADLQEVERLLNEGADVNCRGDGTTKPWTEEDSEKLRAEHGTCEGALGSPQNIEEMKDYRAHPMLAPLHIAAALQPENADLVRLLLDRKADPNIKDRIKRVPIDIAANVGKRSVVDLLAARGAKKNKDVDEKLQKYAQMHGEVSAILQNR